MRMALVALAIGGFLRPVCLLFYKTAGCQHTLCIFQLQKIYAGGQRRGSGMVSLQPEATFLLTLPFAESDCLEHIL